MEDEPLDPPEPPQTTLQAMERAISDLGLMSRIQKLVEEGKSEELDRTLSRPPSALLQETLNRDRLQLTLQIYARLSRRTVELVEKYQQILEDSIKELSRRPVDMLETKELIAIANAAAKWLRPYQAASILHADQKTNTNPATTQAGVNILIQNLHQAQEERAAQEIPQEQPKRKRGRPPLKAIPPLYP